MPTSRPGQAGGHSPWGEDWGVGLRVWVERAGRSILGKGRLELLEGIDRWQSISEAARRMNMSYRRAWLLVQNINEAAGEPLVVAATGGPHGGGARLTPLGRWAAGLFRELQGQLRQTSDTLLPRLLQGRPTASVHVAAAVSLEEVLGQLLADYALEQPAACVRVVSGASDELADLLLAGAPADLFLTADDRQLDRLAAARLVVPRSRTVLAESSLAVIGPTGRAVDVHRPADLLRPSVRRIALAAAPSPLGVYARAYLEDRGLYEALAARAVRVDNSRGVVAAVRAGQADVGLVYGSDAARVPGCRLLFRVRHGPRLIRYTAAVINRGHQPDQARDFLRFLTSPLAARRFRRCGFFPAGRASPD